MVKVTGIKLKASRILMARQKFGIPSKLLSARAVRLINTMKPTEATIDCSLETLGSFHKHFIEYVNDRAEQIHYPLSKKNHVGDVKLANSILKEIKKLPPVEHDDSSNNWFRNRLEHFSKLLKVKEHKPSTSIKNLVNQGIKIEILREIDLYKDMIRSKREQAHALRGLIKEIIARLRTYKARKKGFSKSNKIKQHNISGLKKDISENRKRLDKTRTQIRNAKAALRSLKNRYI